MNSASWGIRPSVLLQFDDDRIPEVCVAPRTEVVEVQVRIYREALRTGGVDQCYPVEFSGTLGGNAVYPEP